MVSPNAVRCINRQRNKVQYFSKHLVSDPRWRKMTGYEPQPLDTDPSQGITSKAASVDMEAEIQRRVQEALSQQSLTGDIGASLTEKPKRKYTKKPKS